MPNLARAFEVGDIIRRGTERRHKVFQHVSDNVFIKVGGAEKVQNLWKIVERYIPADGFA
ncbi:hypothetical protein D3C72_2473000 [compost metagenome]